MRTVVILLELHPELLKLPISSASTAPQAPASGLGGQHTEKVADAHTLQGRPN